MIHTLIIIGLAFLAAALLLLVLLVIRRTVLARRDRRYAEAERRVRPLAIALVEGQSGEQEQPTLSPDDQAVLADVLRRYSRKLTGEADARVAAYFGGKPAVQTALRDLRGRRMWRRAAAAYRLGDMSNPEVAPALLNALDDGRRPVRAAAARSLGRLGIVDAALPLVEALVSGRVPNGVAGQALVELGPTAVPELRRIAEHPDPQVKTAAITLVGLVGDSRATELGVRALEDPSADVRRAAAETLGRIGGPSAEAPLRAALADRLHFVRAAAASALGALRSSAAVPQLLEMARTDRFRPARAAAQAVARTAPRELTAAAAEPGAGPHLHEASDLGAL
jgi:HEAT repeat protein